MRRLLLSFTVLFLLLAVILFLSPFFLKLSGLDTPLKDYLVKQVLVEYGHKIDLENVNFGIGRLEIDNLAFSASDKTLEIIIDKVDFEFSLFNLIKNPADPVNALEDIFLINPKLFFNRVEDSIATNIYVEDDQQNILKELSNLSQIENLIVRNGIISYQKEDSSFFNIASGLNGWLNTTNPKEVVLNLHGSAFDNENDNFNLNATINTKDFSFSSQIDLNNYQLADMNGFGIDEYTKIKSGLADGYIEASGSLNQINSIVFSGAVDLNSIDFTTDLFSINAFEAAINISENKAKINGKFLFNKKEPVEFNFLNDNILSGFFTGKIRSSYNDFSEIVFPGENNHLKFVSWEADFSTDINRNKINIIFSADSVISNNNKLSLLRSSLNYIDGNIDIDGLTFVYENIHFLGKGFYNDSLRNISSSLSINMVAEEHALLDRLSLAAHNAYLSFNFNLNSKKLFGNWSYSLTKSDTVLYALGKINGDSLNMFFNMDSSNYKDFNLNFALSNYNSQPGISYLNVDNFPFESLTTDPLVNDFFNQLITRFDISGKFDQLKGNIYIGSRQYGDSLFYLTSNISDLGSDHIKIEGTAKINSLNGRYELDIGSGFLGSYFNFKDELNGSFFLDVNKDEQLSAEISFDNFKIYKLFLDNFSKDDFRNQAVIDGAIKLSGSLKEPLLQANFSGDKFVFNNLGYYQPVAVIKVSNTRLDIDTLKIFNNNKIVLDGFLNWTFLNDHINGQLVGSEIDLPYLMHTFSIDSSIITGIANYSLNIKGEMNKPVLEAAIEVKNGELDNIPFDLVEIELADNISEGGNFLNYEDHKIDIQNVFITRTGYYHLQGVGNLPLNSTDPVDLVVNFDGDILGLINYWEPFLYDGASFSEILLRFKGTTNKLRLSEADIKIERGELWLKNVAPHIENINGKIILLEGSNKLDMDLTASVQENSLTIKTVRDIVTADGRKLEHWYFSGVDLDFGILSMQTEDDGVRLHIPGLMEKDIFGNIHLSGKNQQEAFYFAGPVRHPVGYGSILLNNAEVTYPFITNSKPGDKPSVAVQFLSNMDWDVILKPGEDVTYVKDIPAYLDNVQTEITVDQSSPGIAFAGIINKGTFKPMGALESSRGRLEYLDQNFRVDYFGLEFTKFNQLPNVTGRAWTTVRDSVGAIPKTIYLELYAIDPETGQERQFGNWEDFKFKLVSADPSDGETQEQVLALLGYSVENIGQKATNVGGAITERYLIRPLLRPLEKVLERGLGMDLVRFNSSIAKNLFYSSLGKQYGYDGEPLYFDPFAENSPYLFLMSSSEITFGKYLSEDLYLTYTGQLISVYDQAEAGYDFNHSFGIEYRFYRNILLELQYDRELLGYYNYLNQRQYLEDFRIRLRHSFSF